MNPIRRYKEWVDKVVESILPAVIEEEIKAVRENRQAKDSRIVANGSSDHACDHLDRSKHTYKGRYDKFDYKFCPKCATPLAEIPYPQMPQ